MSTQPPRFIRVNADIYELKEETVLKPVTDEYFVHKDLDRFAQEQDKFVAGVDALIPRVSKNSFELLEEPIKSLLMPVTTINVNLRSLPRNFTYDTPSEQFYAFEASRWLHVSYLLKLAVQLTQEEIGSGMVDDLLSTQKALAVLKERHKKAFAAAHNNPTRTVTADFDPDATKPVEVEREQAEKEPETQRTNSTQHERVIGAAIICLLKAAQAIATATVKTLGQYDDAAELVAKAHAHIKSDQMSRTSFAQTIKYAGSVYRRV